MVKNGFGGHAPQWNFHVAGVAMLWALSGAVGLNAADGTGFDYFEKNVRPVLVDSCYSCHSAQAEKGIKGGSRSTPRTAC